MALEKSEGGATLSLSLEHSEWHSLSRDTVFRGCPIPRGSCERGAFGMENLCRVPSIRAKGGDLFFFLGRAYVAPMPSASVSTATRLKLGFFASMRNPYFTSCHKVARFMSPPDAPVYRFRRPKIALVGTPVSLVRREGPIRSAAVGLAAAASGATAGLPRACNLAATLRRSRMVILYVVAF